MSAHTCVSICIFLCVRVNTFINLCLCTLSLARACVCEWVGMCGVRAFGSWEWPVRGCEWCDCVWMSVSASLCGVPIAVCECKCMLVWRKCERVCVCVCVCVVCVCERERERESAYVCHCECLSVYVHVNMYGEIWLDSFSLSDFSSLSFRVYIDVSLFLSVCPSVPVCLYIN